jgi:hypothetical protein
MTQRLQRALDGEIPIDQLDPRERGELQRYRATIGTALEPIQRLPSIDISGQVMRQIATNPATSGSPVRGPGLLRRALAWFWSPRGFTLRPAYAVAGALALASILVTVPRRPAVVAVAQPPRVIVQFRLGAGDAREVALVGDFNGWRPQHQLHRIADGVWAVDVALEPGVYNYGFVIDGKTWRLDPLAPRVTDGFGGSSSRLSVLTPAARS